MISSSTLDQAREQYFAAQKTQSQIADDLGIHTKTLSYWIKQNKWRQARTAAQQMPLLLKNNLYTMLASLQNNILSREPHNCFPDAKEAEIQRKLMAGLKQLPGLAVPEAIQLMTEFTTDLVRDKCKITKEVTILCDNYIQKKIQIMDSLDDLFIEDRALPGEEDYIGPSENKTYTRTAELYHETDPTPVSNEEIVPSRFSDLPHNTTGLHPKNVDNSANENLLEKDKNVNNAVDDQLLMQQSKIVQGIKMDKTIHTVQEVHKVTEKALEQEAPATQATIRKGIFNSKLITRNMDNLRYRS